MQGSRRRSSSGSVEPESHNMLSSNPADLFLLPRPPLEAAIPSWSFDLASPSSSFTQIGRFPRPLAAFFDEVHPPSIDLQEGLQQHAAGRPQNEQEEGGYLSEMEERLCCDGFSLREPGTDYSLTYSHLQDLQLQPSRSLTGLEFQDGASLNRNRGLLDEDSNTTPWPPLTPPSSDDSCTTGFSKKPKLSEIAGSPVEIKPQISQSQVKKLGERITALQQLVSPFGKTDTASVLLEAIGYIKFLQEQVQLCNRRFGNKNASIPEIENWFQISGKLPTKSQGAEVGTDLRSRGLCLVPISCTPEVASNNGADYWASGISGRSRC